VALFTRNPYWWGPKPRIQGFGLEFFTNDDTMIAGAPLVSGVSLTSLMAAAR
jgi:hypothetical protein